ncbi:MAG: glucosyl transferase [Ignavibacteriota bacterium]|nr:MAG: glucosyl transferase [Ignavibacteriota bacterium]
MKRVIFGALIISLSLLLQACNTTDPPPPDGEKATLELKLEDVSCIEAWIELTTTNLQLPATITLEQINPAGDTLSHISILNTQDSLLYIDSLLPNQTYKFHTTIQAFNHTSNELSVTTMDTTSHNFTFETFTFGGTAGSSVLYDVAIINENNIWAVGEIYVADTSQNGYTMYNAVHWDGNQWELKRILYDGNIWTIKTIFAFNQNDIWFSAFVRYDGQKFIELPISPILTGWSINKIWGSSSSNLYVVGNNGNIVFYNGTSWSRIESGTDLNIGDIWGITDDSGGYNKYIAADNAMLKLDEDNNLSRIDAEPGMILNSVWGISNRLIYTAGDGIVLYKNNNWEKIYSQGVNTIYRIRGQYYNDICGIGSPGSIIYHFNGYSWASINPDPNNRYRSIDIKENTIAVSGYQGEKAAITILRRNN